MSKHYSVFARSLSKLFEEIIDLFEQRYLHLTMQTQQQSNWCWAAVSTSVAHFYSSSSPWTQCSVVNAELGASTCCTNGSSSSCNQPWYLDLALTRVGHLDHWAGGTATRQQIMTEIDHRRPLGVRIGWSGGGGHFVAIDGYEEDQNERDGGIVEVTDPIYGTSRLLYETLVSSYQSTGSWTHSYWTKR